jgi:hypothetical protein
MRLRRLFTFPLLFPTVKEDPEFLGCPWREIEKMNSRGNGFFKEM